MSYDRPTMPYQDLEISSSEIEGGDPRTTEMPAGGPPPDGVAFDDPDSEWIVEDQRKDVRLRIPTAVLVVLLIAACGFWGGAALQKHHSKSTTVGATASARAAFASGATGRTGFAGAGATNPAGAGAATGAGATGAATSGLVTDVQGSTVYVTDQTGALIKVAVGATTTITRTSNSTDGGLQTGDTVVVRGAKAADGTVTATAIVATAKGVQGLSSGQTGAGGGTGFGRAPGGGGTATGG
jgi:hypothetical protein